MRSAIVLGAREGNIGGAIVDKINAPPRYDSGEPMPLVDSGQPATVSGWRATADDCHFGHEMYVPPKTGVLGAYDACVITLGVTHIESFGDQTNANIAKVLRGSLELPLLCAKNYVRGRQIGSGTSYEVVYPPSKVTKPSSPPANGGIIIFVGSYAHDHPLTNSTTYCVAKAGLDMACRSLAWELMPEFRVHIIHPHHVQGTPMSTEVKKSMMRGRKMTAKGADAYARKDLRMPDTLKPEEIAEVVAFLLTNPAAAWTSGTGINLYGGVR